MCDHHQLLALELSRQRSAGFTKESFQKILRFCGEPQKICSRVSLIQSNTLFLFCLVQRKPILLYNHVILIMILSQLTNGSFSDVFPWPPFRYALKVESAGGRGLGLTYQLFPSYSGLLPYMRVISPSTSKISQT